VFCPLAVQALLHTWPEPNPTCIQHACCTLYYTCKGNITKKNSVWGPTPQFLPSKEQKNMWTYKYSLPIYIYTKLRMQRIYGTTLWTFGTNHGIRTSLSSPAACVHQAVKFILHANMSDTEELFRLHNITSNYARVCLSMQTESWILLEPIVNFYRDSIKKKDNGGERRTEQRLATSSDRRWGPSIMCFDSLKTEQPNIAFGGPIRASKWKTN
jgi:hypothetical protein